MSKAEKSLQEPKRYFSPKDPFIMFNNWFNEASRTEVIREANTMALATASKDGKPSVRCMLMKSHTKEGITFYTNYSSRKGQEIADNPQVALLFYWQPLYLQIRIEGEAVKTDAKESEEYFHSRPKTNQLSTATSNQDEVVESLKVLVKKKDELRQKYADESAVIPKPEHWGGYLVKPDSYEFWYGHADRLHDRIRFRRPFPKEKPDEKLVHTGEDGWVYEYLSP